MSKKRRSDRSSPDPAPAPSAPPAVTTRFSPSPASLAALVALGTVAALWALMLWGELVASRVGGVPVCAIGDSSACAALWDSPFASSVHRLSGVPVAGWGLAWGLAALALPLLALLRVAEARPPVALVSAIRLVAAAGAASVLVLLTMGAVAGALCLGCVGTYVVVAGYAGIALFGWPGAGLPDAARGAVYAGTAVLVAFVLLLYPGARTPRAAGEAGREAVAAAASGFGGGSGTGDARRDEQVQQLVSMLAPQMKQRLADSLLIHRQSLYFAPPEARRLHGPEGAPVRITTWSDVLCGHCADLHRTLQSLEDHAPAGSFAVDARQFPLDGGCNPLVERATNPLRCEAAKVMICLEGHERESELVGAVFEAQESLTREKLYEIVTPAVPRGRLEACVASADTERRLRDDIEAAARYEPDGTPLVTVNGRRGTSIGPFLYAMALTGGAADHPAFAALPPPDPSAHLH